MKSKPEIAMEHVDMAEEPVGPVLTLDLEMLAANGIRIARDDNKLSFWSDRSSHTNKNFEHYGIKLVDAAGYDGLESHIMFEAINRAELQIRLIQVLQGKGIS